ncbi:MAG: FUSC family protein [Cyanobacteriota bacterium]|nr:FUSC family protein [Cyanobacteriota bacterium]
MTADLPRNSLKLAVAIWITAALAEHFDRLVYAWYPLLAVVIVVDDNDDHTLLAASGRILGTVAGCLLTFLVHSVASGWPGVLLSLLLLVPLLRLLGWQSAMGTAGLIPIVFLMIPSHAALDWSYAFHRTLDTAIGCAVALAVGLLFWPKDGLSQLSATEAGLLRQLHGQLGAYRRWLAGETPRPEPLPAAALSAAVERMETLLRQELAGPRWQVPGVQRWRRRVALWQTLRLHWVQWERLLVASDLPAPAPDQPALLRDALETLSAHLERGCPLAPPAATLAAWTQLARLSGRPLLTLLALGEEQRPLLASTRQLAELRLAPSR